MCVIFLYNNNPYRIFGLSSVYLEKNGVTDVWMINLHLKIYLSEVHSFVFFHN